LASGEGDRLLRNSLLFFVEQAIAGMSLLNRYAPSHFSQVNRVMSGRIRAFSQHSECSPWYVLGGKAKRLASAFSGFERHYSMSMTTTGDCGSTQLPSNSIDYVFTDPPFGFNFAYAELNFLVEAWHRVFTSTPKEAIVSDFQKKGISEYQNLMYASFSECYLEIDTRGAGYGRLCDCGRANFR
jgi:16S rRNA G966 N2-methylase RsmD